MLKYPATFFHIENIYWPHDAKQTKEHTTYHTKKCFMTLLLFSIETPHSNPKIYINQLSYITICLDMSDYATECIKPSDVHAEVVK